MISKMLSEITSVITKGTTPTSVGCSFSKNGINYIKSESITSSRTLDKSKYAFISEETHQKLKRSQIKENDILFSMAGMFLGKTGIVQADDVPANTNQAVAIIRIVPEQANYLYVYYYLNQKNIVTWINSLSGQSAQPNINLKQIGEIEIPLPDRIIQDTIVEMLSAIDSRIELNTAINENLEKQAQALFKAWFVDFEPFGGAMPDDWTETTLGTIAAISTKSINPLKQPDLYLEHYSIPAYDEQHYPVFEYASEVKSNKYILTNNSVMISKLNPDTKRIWRPLCLSANPVCSTEFIVYEAVNPKYKDYIYSLIDSQAFSDYLCAHTTGSTNSRQRATPKTTLDYTCIMPSDDIITRFCGIVTPMYDQIASNIIESQRLAALRDTLLPKLMNGEIDVSAVKI